MTCYTSISSFSAAVALMLLMVLELDAASPPAPAPPMEGVPGCDTTCGNVSVPYPFGMGPSRCYHSPGFNLTCDNTTTPPQLLLGDGTLRVDLISLESLGVRVLRTAGDIKVDAGGSGSLGGGLGDGPFSLAPLRNELILVGCNAQATLRSGNITMSSCSSMCVNGDEPLTLPTSGNGLLSPCSGIGCCQAPVVGITSQDYEVELNYFGSNRTADHRWPARVLVAERGWFLSAQPSQKPVPFWLDWEVTSVCKSKHTNWFKGRRGGYTCLCKDGYHGNPYIPDFNECDQPEPLRICYGECTNTMGSFECHCPPGTRGNPEMPGGCFASHTGKCSRWCGKVHVDYPFGIGPDRCSLPGFNLTCDTDHHPPRLLLGNYGIFEVVDISLRNNTLRIINTGPALGMRAGDTTIFFDDIFRGRGQLPYSVSTRNELILMGCDVQAGLFGNAAILSGCSSFCYSDENGTMVPGGSNNGTEEQQHCYGIGCCKSRIATSIDGMPKALILQSIDRSIDLDETSMPSFTLIAEEGWLDKHQISTQFLQHKWTTLKVPIILDWEVLQPPGLQPLANISLQPHRSCPVDVANSLCKSKNSLCKPTTRGYLCQCSDKYDGNPYILNGCKGVGHKNFKGMAAVVGLGAASGFGLILLVLVLLFISKKIKHRRAQKMRQKFFEQNRGQLLEQLVSQRADIAERMIISLEELEKATNNFDKTRELGGGGHGTVYKGILSDLHVVAIKKPKKVVQNEIDEFINEVAILSQINHRNVVKLYGCCLETEVPMLVYEFISNGTLHDHLHIIGPSSLSWDDRLRIAVETAKSIAYLHSTASIPIIHRDIKSVNILLDDTLTAKVADFGASKYVPMDKSEIITRVQGTIGYMDPMYFYTGRLTEKSDVYGFGVMLVELLTRQKPFSYLSSEGEGLVTHFSTLFAQGELPQILDPQVMAEGGKEIEEVSEVAVACIKLTSEDRPTMRQVEMVLEGLRSSAQYTIDHAVAKNTDINAIDKFKKSGEVLTRQYSMEEEFIVSARYPR